MAAMEVTAAPVPSEEIPPANPEPFAGENAMEDGGGVESTCAKRKRDEEEEEGEEGGGVEDGGGKGVDDARNDGTKQDLYWKTSLCSYYRRRPGLAGCSHGDDCQYAHGEAELRPRPDNTWDPTSERAKKLLAVDNGVKEVETLAVEEYTITVDATSLDKSLIGLPKRWGTEKLKGFLDDQGILYKTAKKKKGMTVGFASFDNVQQLTEAIEALKESSTGGKQIKVADAISRSYGKRTVMQKPSNQLKEQLVDTELCTDNPGSVCLLEDGDATEKDNPVLGVVSTTRTARDVVTPLADIPYGDQLDQKKNSLMQILKKLTRNARKACPTSVSLPEWVMKCREIGGLPCKLEGILESPLTIGYRNKCEFSVGCSLQGKPTVGFMIGSFREGITAIEEPINCPNVSRISTEFARIFQEFLQSSELPIWNRLENKGFWRQFTVREGRKPRPDASILCVDIEIAEVMIIIQVCSSDIDEEAMKKEFQRMVHALELGAAACSPSLPLTVIVVQDYKGISNAAPADCPLIPLMVPQVGQPHPENENATEARIHDYISNLRFSISPTAFFQVNTLAAERLYSLAGDWADLNPDTLLFDICCGTGTIGLTLAHRVGMVVGIEMNASAVSDAERNAKINNITNCRFVCGKAEDIIGPLLKEYLDVPEQTSSTGCNTKENLEVKDISAENPDEVIHADDNVRETLAGVSLAVDGPDRDSNGTMGAVGNGTAGCSDITEDNGDCKEPVQDSTSKNNDGASIRRFKNVVAIVDPPRPGLHPVVIKALRTHPRIRRLVYISCNPESLVANAIELCTPTADDPEKGKGSKIWWKMTGAALARHRTKSMPKSEPFQPVRAMAVDMFPHTSHCEMVMHLER